MAKRTLSFSNVKSSQVLLTATQCAVEPRIGDLEIDGTVGQIQARLAYFGILIQIRIRKTSHFLETLRLLSCRQRHRCYLIGMRFHYLYWILFLFGACQSEFSATEISAGAAAYRYAGVDSTVTLLAPSSAGLRVGSGVVIAPNAVLTAAHVVNGLPAESIIVSVDNALTLNPSTADFQNLPNESSETIKFCFEGRRTILSMSCSQHLQHR